MSIQIRVVGLVASAIIASAASAQTAVEWKVSKGGNGHWYDLVAADYSLTWPQLNAHWAQRGAHLCTITSAAENAWVADRIVINPPGDGALLGGYVAQGGAGSVGWAWITGEPWSFELWATGAPGGPANEHYVYMTDQVHWGAPSGYWDDCPWGYGGSPMAVIEWDADCNADGIVDYGQIREGKLADFNGNNIPDCCERREPCVSGNFPVEWKVSEGGNGHWYQIINLAGQGEIYWQASRSSAIRAGGDLACFESAAETTAFLNLTSGQTRGNPWIGLYQDHSAADYKEPAGGWRWTSGASLAWTNWASGEPNNAVGEDWANMWINNGAPGTWNDYKPTNPQGPDGFIIEWAADCNGDGIVDYGQILRGDIVDRDGNGVPDSCQCASSLSLAICCASDLDLDGEVSTSDISLLLLSFGEQRWLAPECDLDGDGTIGGGDLSVILLDFGPCEETPTALAAPIQTPLLADEPAQKPTQR